jgi:hypothetical protein
VNGFVDRLRELHEKASEPVSPIGRTGQEWREEIERQQEPLKDFLYDTLPAIIEALEAAEKVGQKRMERVTPLGIDFELIDKLRALDALVEKTP